MQNIIDKIITAVKNHNTESIILQRDNLSYLVPTDKPEYLDMLLRFVLANFDTIKGPQDVFFENNDLYVLFDSRRDKFAEV